MEFIYYIIDLFLHLDRHLNEIADAYQGWTYLILFLVVFCETGLVVTPFLPGDSLLFAVGALAATEGSVLDPWLCFVLLATAAILGDTVNYWIGYLIGPKAYQANRYRFIKKDYLDRTHEFYARHGGKTIILARFVPIIRTFAPFVAGIGKMNYGRFISYNIIGGLVWPAIFVWAGHRFGSVETVRGNFTLVILAIVALSCLPIAYEAFGHWRRRRRALPAEPAQDQ